MSWELQIMQPCTITIRYQLTDESGENRRWLPYYVDMLNAPQDEERWALYRRGEGAAPGVLIDVFFELRDAQIEGEKLAKDGEAE